MVFITGGTDGIGFQAARMLVDLGCSHRVVVSSGSRWTLAWAVALNTRIVVIHKMSFSSKCISSRVRIIVVNVIA